MKNILRKTYYWFIINIVLIIPGTAGADGNLSNPLNSSSFVEVVGKVADFAAKIGVPIAAVFIIYSGFLFVTARGSEDKLKSAKETFTWTIIGTAILMGAWVLAKAITTTIKSF